MGPRGGMTRRARRPPVPDAGENWIDAPRSPRFAVVDATGTNDAPPAGSASNDLRLRQRILAMHRPEYVFCPT